MLGMLAGVIAFLGMSAGPLGQKKQRRHPKH